MPLHDKGRAVTVVISRPSVITRDGLDRPGDPADIASAIHASGLLPATCEEVTVAYKRERPGTRAKLALCLMTYDRRIVLQGDHVEITPWPPDSGLTVNLFVADPERFWRTQDIYCVDHLEAT